MGSCVSNPSDYKNVCDMPDTYAATKLFAVGHHTGSGSKWTTVTTHLNVINDVSKIYDGVCYTLYADDNNEHLYLTRHNSKKIEDINFFNQNDISIKKICRSICSVHTFYIAYNNKIYSNINNWVQVISPLNINFKGMIIDIQSTARFSFALCSDIQLLPIIINHWCRFQFQIIPNDISNLIMLFYDAKNKVYCLKNYKNPSKWMLMNKSKDHIIKIQCGSQHSLFLAANGSLYGHGESRHGQLGVEIKRTKRNYNYFKLTQIPFFAQNNIKIKDISCAAHHNLAIDWNDNVYSWGVNTSGQCGNGISTEFQTPKLIETLKTYQIKTIKCGYHHSYVMTYDNKHFLFGDNRFLFGHEFAISFPHCINKEIENISHGKEVALVSLFSNTLFVIMNK